MTPEEILTRAEALGALSPEAVSNIIKVGLVFVALLLALGFVYYVKGGSKKDESEASALTTALKSLSTSVDRQHAREDKADALIASMTQVSAESISATREILSATQKTLNALLESVDKMALALGGIKTMGENIAENDKKLDKVIELVDEQGQILKKLVETVELIKETQAKEVQALNLRLEQASQANKEQTDA